MDNAVIQAIEQFMNQHGVLNVNQMRPHAGVHANALLRKDEWLELDQAILAVSRPRLIGVQDLVGRGLTRRHSGLGAIFSGYERQSDMDPAVIDMDGGTPGEEDRVEFDQVNVPIPIIHKDFRLSKRHLEASRKLGDSLDTTQAEEAGRKVAEAAEALLFNGTGALTVGGVTIYGYANHPNRVTDTAAGYGGGDFGVEGNGYKTIVGMIDALTAKGFTGPFGLYLASPQYNELLSRHTDGSSKSELNAIMEGIPELEFVKKSFDLAAANGVMVNLSRETVDLAIAQDLVTVQWESRGGMSTHFMVMLASVPRIKADKNNSCGVVHVTGA